ncbi:MAG: carboxypeptidase-like regulatory domain-containing protein [Patescibacteria group bacterium]|nr:carboxypeptidase-like regulatory domain-containing protein [Patescibacteria group bacterium]
MLIYINTNKILDYLSKGAFLVLLLLPIFFFSPLGAFASSTDGVIDSVRQYAWTENSGWLNFGTSEGNVHVFDMVLTGYAWGENVGWISLNCANDNSCDISDYKVANDGEGNLSGYAYGENIGWINFNPENGGITINRTGDFSGYAWGENIGWVVFNCATTNSCATVDYGIKTDWRPRSARPQCNNGIDDDGDGRIDYPDDPGCVSLDDDFEADDPGPIPMYILSPSSSGQTSEEIPAEPSEPEIPAEQPEPSFVEDIKEGAEKTIDALKPIIKKPVESVKKTIDKVIDLFKPIPTDKEIAEEEIEKLVPQEAPPSLKGEWTLLPQESIDRFALMPLPRELSLLINKFPDLEKTFKELGIRKITDLEKLEGVRLILPGLTQAIGLVGGEGPDGEIVLSGGIPLPKLPDTAKDKIPEGIVFARAAGDYIDFNMELTISRQGETQSKINVISGHTLSLLIKPEGEVDSIKGYIAFKSQNLNPVTYNLKPEASGQRVLNSKFQEIVSGLFALPAMAQTGGESGYAVPGENNISDFEFSETRLILSEFYYTDPDADGIYTAEIQAPLVQGNYEIITEVDYKDPKLGRKEIKLITVVDPEGYVYEKTGDKETRLPETVVSIYWLNPETGGFELWQSSKYQQQNPQTTDITGRYSFLVPPGEYYLAAKAPGYLPWQGERFEVKEGRNVHFNIEMKTKYGFLKIFDWKAVLLIGLAILLFYNFYRDRRRERNKN